MNEAGDSALVTPACPFGYLLFLIPGERENPYVPLIIFILRLL